MKVTGIIAEYDPFHNGHSYHIKKAREMTGADAVVAVMSGHFTQRGMPAFFSRDARARMAVDGGADLVIELPYIYACNSSHEFARGAVGILDGLGCVDDIVFGAETDTINVLERAARAAAREDSEMSAYIKEEMKNGISYPEALTRSVEKRYGAETAEALRSPNDLLGIEYMKAIYAFGSDIRPRAVGRIAAAHDEPLEDTKTMESAKKWQRSLKEAERAENDTGARIASGTAVRQAVYARGARAAEAMIPETSFKIILDEEKRLRTQSLENAPFSLQDNIAVGGGASAVNNYFAITFDAVKKNMFELLKYRILTSDERELGEIYGVSEGLENRLKSCLAASDSVDGLLDAVKSKRYTRARISRTLMHILINLKDADFKQMRGHFHARVLGFTPTGGKLLREISESASIPVFSNLSRLDRRDPQAARVLSYDMRASDVYAMLCGSGDAPGRERRFIPYAAGRQRAYM